MPFRRMRRGVSALASDQIGVKSTTPRAPAATPVGGPGRKITTPSRYFAGTAPSSFYGPGGSPGGGSRPRGGGSRGGRRSGGGGFGGGGGGGRDLEAEHKKRMAAIRKAIDRAIYVHKAQGWSQQVGINKLHDRAQSDIKGYHGDYNKALGGIRKDQAKESAAINAALARLGQQTQAGFDQWANPIEADLMAQGVSASGLRSDLSMDRRGALAQTSAAQTFNHQLQAAATAAHSDFRRAGQHTRQAGRTMATNERQAATNAHQQAYQQALTELQLQRAQAV
jgi:hypothetical protein